MTVWCLNYKSWPSWVSSEPVFMHSWDMVRNVRTRKNDSSNSQEGPLKSQKIIGSMCLFQSLRALETPKSFGFYPLDSHTISHSISYRIRSTSTFGPGVYRAAEPISMQNWINWRQDFVRRPDALVWDPPEALGLGMAGAMKTCILRRQCDILSDHCQCCAFKT